MKNFKRVGRFISIFYPINIYKIILFFYTYQNPRTRTIELLEIIKDQKYTTFLEVGVWKGDNILQIAKKLSHCICYGVDPYDYKQYDNQISEKDNKGQYLRTESELIYQNTKHFENLYSNFVLLRMSSVEAASKFEDESLDLIFIDANHSYKSVTADIDLWFPKVKKGGCLSGHDYSIEFYGVIQAVNEKLGVDNIFIRSEATWFYYKN